MSDVERIVNTNNERVRWAEEYAHAAPQEDKAALPKDRKQRNDSKFQVIHTAALACAMFAGAGAAFAGIGLANGQGLTLGVGLLVTTVFIATGARLDAWARTA